MKPRRLWIFTSEYVPNIIGGLGTVATHLTRAYVRAGVHTTVLTESRGSYIKHVNKNRLQIVRLPSRNIYYSSKSMQYKPAAVEKHLSKQVKPDGIHIHSLKFTNAAKYFQAKYRIPIIYTCHSLVVMEPGPITKKKQKMLTSQKQLLRIANRIVVPSQSHFSELKKYYPFCVYKTVIIKHGIVLRKSIARAPRHHLLFVGRIVPSKGVGQLITAISLLKRQGKKVRLDLVGTGSKGYIRYLRARSKKLGLSSVIHWKGHCTPAQVQKMYASHGAAIMPSRQESFGLVALEALASGIPLVSTRAGGLSEFVNSNVAQTIPKVNGAAIARSIQKMWNNKRITNQRVMAGRKLASRFQWSHAASRYTELFEQI